jgi:gamma-glutamylcyclotransferase (GGCT)/AIG2-like uncharacterized protein YtfP
MILHGATLDEIEGMQTNNRIICRMILSGDNIAKLQLTYLNGEAQANVLKMRSMVGQVNAWIYAAKKKIKTQLQQQIPSGGGAA